MNDVDGTYNCKIQMVTSTSGRYRKIKVNNTNKRSCLTRRTLSFNK